MKRAIIFVGRVENAFWEQWVPFCEKHDLDVYLVSYAKTREYFQKLLGEVKNRFGNRLKKYYVDRTTVDSLEYNNWKIHTRTIQFWRLWDFYMKNICLRNYDVLVKARFDTPIPQGLVIPEKVEKNTLYVPEYKKHPFGLSYTDQIAFGDKTVMEKYCRLWEMLPSDIEGISDGEMQNLFFGELSGESLVISLIEKSKVKTKLIYFLTEDFSHITKQKPILV